MGKFEDILAQNYLAQQFQLKKEEEEAKRKKASEKRCETLKYKATKSKYILDFEEAIAKKYGRRYIFDDRTANGLTKFIMAFLEFYGHYSARINTGGTAVGARAAGGKDVLKWATSGSTNGVADIIACIDGRFVQLEVKAGSDRPREDQLEQQRYTIEAGGAYVFVHDANEFVLLYTLIKKGFYPYEIVRKRNFAKSDIRPNETVGLYYDDDKVAIIDHTNGDEMNRIGAGLKKIYYMRMFPKLN